MATVTLTGFIARETEKAVAFVGYPVAGEHKPLWIPRKKISRLIETDALSASVQLAGESIRRLATPVEIDVDTAFMGRIAG